MVSATRVSQRTVKQMSDLINGRTPDEIKTAVLCTEKGTIPDCPNCPYYGELDENGFRAYQCHQANFDLIAYAEHLESQRDDALAKVPKWISVKERLPTKEDAPGDERVLCVISKVAGDMAGERRAYHWEMVVNHPAWFTHWMPLPSAEGLK